MKIFKRQKNDFESSVVGVLYNDYRLSNRCNFMCKTCSGDSSSRWNDITPERNLLLMTRSEERQAEQELMAALERGEIREIYWAGGEPLISDFHWDFMKRAVEGGFSKEIYSRYVTNLSTIRRKGLHLINDLLQYFEGIHIGMSIDGAGKIGEYIRSGLNWSGWKENFLEIHSYCKDKPGKEMGMNVALTLPGILGLKEIVDLSVENQVYIYPQMVYENGNLTWLLSPCSAPREIVQPLIIDLVEYIENKNSVFPNNLLDLLKQVLELPTYQETFPDTYRESFIAAREKLLQHEKQTNCKTTLSEIYSANKSLLGWWEQ